VPDPGNALDYHRYAYVRFNPLKYEDGSGHCATLANGQADWESDYECWQLAYLIYGHGLGQGAAAASFAADWKVSPEEWLKNIASQSFADADYLRPFAERYYDVWAGEVGLPVHPVEWHQPPDYRLLNEPEIIGFLRGERTVCETWDCGAISLDLAALGVQISRDTSLLSIPITTFGGVAGFTTGQAAQYSLTAIGLGYVSLEVANGKASTVDLTVNVVTSIAGFIPVAGEFATGAQLLWDIFDPFHPW